jgi:mono/diheme cytochrome c family protein
MMGSAACIAVRILFYPLRAAVRRVTDREDAVQSRPKQGRFATRARALVGLGALWCAASAAEHAHAAEPIPPAAVQEANKIYQTRCVMCHGADGKGDGPAAAALSPRPRSLGDPGWQQSVDDAHIEKILLSGGAAVGKSPLMPPNPDLSGKPDVLRALRQLVRDFGTAP